MVVAVRPDVGDVQTLAASWKRSLRAENKSPCTIETYEQSLDQLVAFLLERGMPSDLRRDGGRLRERLEALPPAPRLS
jgi:hypothetical protein